MITKRLLRFALGPSFLINDDSDSEADDTPQAMLPHKQRSVALYNAQTHVLSSLGVYAGQLYRMQNNRTAPPPPPEADVPEEPEQPEEPETTEEIDKSTEVSADKSLELQKFHASLEIKQGRAMLMLGTFFFVGSALGSVIYDLKVQAMTIDDGGTMPVLDIIKTSLRSSSPMAFVSSFGVSLLCDLMETLFVVVLTATPIYDNPISEFLIGSQLREILMYPFRELSLAHSLRIADPWDLFPSLSSYTRMFTPSSFVRSIPKYMLICYAKKLQQIINGAFSFVIPKSLGGFLSKSDEPLFENDLSDPSTPPVALNLAANGVYTYARTIVAEALTSMSLLSIDPIIFRAIARSYLTSHPSPSSPAILPVFSNFDLHHISRLCLILGAEWTLQFSLFELLSSVSLALEFFDVI